MSQLLESIKVSEGVICNLDYHLKRVKNSCKEVFNKLAVFEAFANYVDELSVPHEGLWKLRIEYDHHAITHSFQPYQLKPIRSLKMLEDDGIRYHHKFSHRTVIKNLYAQRQTADDILIVRQGLITDSSYANVAFLKNGFWFTPDQPLLKGTKRAQLIDDLKIIPITIKKKDVLGFEACRLFNALIEFGELEISCLLIK